APEGLKAPPQAAPAAESAPPMHVSEPPPRAEVVSYLAEAPAALVTIVRPDRRNAIDDDVVNGLHAALDRALDDERVRAVIVTGAGDAFSAGLDLKDINAHKDLSHDECVAESEALARLFRRLRSFEKVTIAAVNGAAFGSGCGLAALCDFTIAAKSAELGFTELRLGFVPAV